MIDITKRLRDANEELCDEAANEIEMLRGTIILLAAHAEKYMTTDQQLADFRKLIADEATESRGTETE